MEGEAPTHASTPTRAVFLSYASQDSEVAGRICDALRAAGIDVWFDKSELRGGDAWDRQIRRQIHDCALFIPIISANSQARLEGYFRLEWKLAVERTHLMSDRVAFLVPVVIDDTCDAQADVPEPFRAVQWTRLPGGETQPEFVARIKRLLSPEPLAATGLRAAAASRSSITRQTTRRPWPQRNALPIAVAVLVVSVLGYLLINKTWISEPGALSATSNAKSSLAPAAAFTPPPHSIAVLPFVNMSGDKDQQYFSDGLTEEILNSLTRINELQVAARTSSFSFQGEHPDIASVAHKLNVASVLEGSVRRSGRTLRVTAQLNNAATGFHIWSQTYDRDLGDVLALQAEIATAVASALKTTLLGDEAAKLELGGTRNAAAFDAYLHGSKAMSLVHTREDVQTAIAAYTEAIRLDPDYALAFASRSITYTDYALGYTVGPALLDGFNKAHRDAHQAIVLAPDLAEGHLALAFVLDASLDFSGASRAYAHARELAPGNAEVLRRSGRFEVWMGHYDAGLAAGRRAAVLDPLDPRSHTSLGQGLFFARRYEEAVAALGEVISLDPNHRVVYGYRGLAYYKLGNLQSALSSCETQPDSWTSQLCLAVVYDRLGRHADAEGELTKMNASLGESSRYQDAAIYAEWGNRAKALECLDTSLQRRDPSLAVLKTDPLMDSLRNEPRFQAIERALKFP